MVVEGFISVLAGEWCSLLAALLSLRQNAQMGKNTIIKFLRAAFIKHSNNNDHFHFWVFIIQAKHVLITILNVLISL